MATLSPASIPPNTRNGQDDHEIVGVSAQAEPVKAAVLSLSPSVIRASFPRYELESNEPRNGRDAGIGFEYRNPGLLFPLNGGWAS